MRSKPDSVDQPERTAHYDCAMCIAEMLHNTIAHYTIALLVSLFVLALVVSLSNSIFIVPE